jgi:hypothetical protein
MKTVTGEEWQVVKELCQQQWFNRGYLDNPFRSDQWQFRAWAERALEISSRIVAMNGVIDGEYRRLPDAPVIEETRNDQ